MLSRSCAKVSGCFKSLKRTAGPSTPPVLKLSSAKTKPARRSAARGHIQSISGFDGSSYHFKEQAVLERVGVHTDVIAVQHLSKSVDRVLNHMGAEANPSANNPCVSCVIGTRDLDNSSHV